MHSDHQAYLKFTSRSRLEKSINTLIGLVEGIVIDGQINDREISFLKTWVEDNGDVSNTHPFNELIPAINQAIKSCVIHEDEKQDILWLCKKVRSTDFIDSSSADMQRLHALLGGIAADSEITEAELRGLSSWLSEHEHLATIWPYDEVVGIVSGILADGKIDADEHRMALDFFLGFTAILDDRTIRAPIFADGKQLVGVCAVQPTIVFEGQTFCLTGASCRYTRDEFSSLIRNHGGRVVSAMSSKVDYLVVGSDGNPCWMYACYGRKVEQAIELRKSGSRLMIVHENDFYDAIEDGR